MKIPGQLKSKTLWFNVLSFASLILSGATGIPLPISPTTAATGIAMVNFGLRFLTDKPLTEK